MKKRTFYMEEAYIQIAKDFGKDKVMKMQQVSKDLINGDEIDYPQYIKIKKKKFGFI